MLLARLCMVRECVGGVRGAGGGGRRGGGRRAVGCFSRLSYRHCLLVGGGYREDRGGDGGSGGGGVMMRGATVLWGGWKS